jgi:hypothetical protein
MSRKPPVRAVDPAVARCIEAATEKIETCPVTRARAQWADDVWHSFSAGDRFAIAVHIDALWCEGRHKKGTPW